MTGYRRYAIIEGSTNQSAGFTAMTKQELFQECINGYGFEEIEQSPEGLFCEGCLQVHKKPTKMYSNSKTGIGKCICRSGILYFFNIFDEIIKRGIL